MARAIEVMDPHGAGTGGMGTHSPAAAGPADPRRFLEWGLRGVALMALGLLLAGVVRGPDTPAEAAAGPDAIHEALTRWSTTQAPREAHVTFGEPASPEVRDWLAALRATGTAIRWDGAAPLPAAVAIEPIVDPARPARLWVAAPRGTRVTVLDRFGPIAEVSIAGLGGRIVIPQVAGGITAIAAPVADGAAGTDSSAAGGTNGQASSVTRMTTALRDSLEIKPVLVLGEASWEAKFAIAALEEHGWTVHARLAVAPSGDVRQGPESIRIDTASYAAVIALDSVAARYARQLRTYVEQGGGLIAMGEGAALRELEAILPAAVLGPASAPERFVDDPTSSPRDALALAALGRLEDGALVIERRGDDVAAAAWRVGEGRVLQVGYLDTWRWRLAGAGDDAPAEHRAWWAALVSSVAYAPRFPIHTAEALEPAPLASHIAALGPPSAPRPGRAASWGDRRPWLFALLLAALLGEWGSRRLRGQP
jgi:hypothetical protein